MEKWFKFIVEKVVVNNKKEWEFLLPKNIKNQHQKSLVVLLYMLMKVLRNSQLIKLLI